MKQGLFFCAFSVLVLTAPLVSSQTRGATVLSFTDVTTQAGVNVTHGTRGFNHANYTGGGAVGDFNGDGAQDLFVLSGGDDNQPDWLFINNLDGTFTDRAAEWGLTDVHRGKGASVADVNGDGLLDIYVTSAGPVDSVGPGFHRLYMNQGGSFTNEATTRGVNVTTPYAEDGFGSTFGDIDLDGDLDLFVAGFVSNNEGSRLFENDGNGFFTDITQKIGFFAGTPITLRSFAPRFADMDGDRYPEALLASDFGSSRYFRNNGNGTFTDVTESAGTGLDENGMGQTIGDFNNDGLLDWYVTSIYHPSLSMPYTGNKLYLNDGNHKYTEVAKDRGVDAGGYGWGALAVDFDHDGRLDIAETNGAGSFSGEQSYLWLQNNNGTFVERALATGFAHFGQGRGIVNFDYDLDGDQDVVIFSFNGPLRMYRNDLEGPDANWLRVLLDTSEDDTMAPFGYGARVTLTVGKESQMRMITSGDNFLSHSELSAHFGLGPATVVDELRVDWADGASTTLESIAANLHVTVFSDGNFSLQNPGFPDPTLCEVLGNFETRLGIFYSEFEITDDGMVDLAGEGLPDLFALALVGQGGCIGDDASLTSATESAFETNRARVIELTLGKGASDHADIIAALALTSDAMAARLTLILDEAGYVTASLQFEVVECDSKGCTPQPVPKQRGILDSKQSVDQPYSANGDFDGDEASNSEEFENTQAAGGDRDDFVEAAIDPETDGSADKMDCGASVGRSAPGTKRADALVLFAAITCLIRMGRTRRRVKP